MFGLLMNSMVLFRPMRDTRPNGVRPSANVLAAAVDNEVVLLDTRSGRYFSLNKTGARVWQGITEGIPVADVARDVASTWSVPFEIAERDTQRLLGELERRALVTTGETNGE